MTIDDIKQLTQNLESQHLEFKKTTGQLDAGMETLCAFLNGDGGTVLFGVSDKGEIKGQEVSDDTKRNIAEAIARFEPKPIVDVEYIGVPSSKEKQVIVFRAESQHSLRPFTFRGRPFHRIQTVTSVMSQEEYRYLLFSRTDDKYSWDRMLNPELKLSDLDENAFWGAIRTGINSGRLPETTANESMESILGKMELSREGKLTNAAAVLFGKQHIGYMQCYVRLARFRGIDKNEFIDNQQVNGNIYRLLDAVMAFFFKHLPLSAKVDDLYREEELYIPRKALRECCINALCHRRYDVAGSSVGIAIYDDRIEVESYGALPETMTIEDLLGTHRSEPRNRLIADTLYKTCLLENWGRGISLMRTECARVGQPEPEFVNEPRFFVVRFKFSLPLNTVVSKQVSKQVSEQVSEQVQTLVLLLDGKELSLKNIMDSLGKKSREYVRSHYIKTALEAGYISALFPDSPNTPKQKYRLTDKGKQLFIILKQEKLK